MDDDVVKPTPHEVQEAFPEITKDEYIRLECLTQAVKTNAHIAVGVYDIIERARFYEQYIRNGAFEHA